MICIFAAHFYVQLLCLWLQRNLILFLRKVAAVGFTSAWLLAVLVLLGVLTAKGDFVGSWGELFSLLTALLVLKVWQNHDIWLWWRRNRQNNNLITFIHASTSSNEFVDLRLSVLRISKLVCDVASWKWSFFKCLVLMESVRGKRTPNTCFMINHQCVIDWLNGIMVLERLNKLICRLLLCFQNWILVHHDHARVNVCLCETCYHNSWFLLAWYKRCACLQTLFRLVLRLLVITSNWRSLSHLHLTEVRVEVFLLHHVLIGVVVFHLGSLAILEFTLSIPLGKYLRF